MPYTVKSNSIKYILIFIILILFLALISYILYIISIMNNKDKLILWWNSMLMDKMDKDSSFNLKQSPYSSAWTSNNKYIRDFHSMITINYRSIYKEIFDAIETGKFILPHSSTKEDSFVVSNEVYNRRLNKSLYSLPALTKLARENRYVEQVQVTIMSKSHITKSRVYDNKGLERYIYIIKNKNDEQVYQSKSGKNIELYGIKILGTLLPIKEGNGFVFDDTLSNHWWNFTENTIVLIEARISRDLGLIYNCMHSFVLKYDEIMKLGFLNPLIGIVNVFSEEIISTE